MTMKKFGLALLLTALVTSVALAVFPNGTAHVGISGTVDNTSLARFDYFGAINDGASKVTVQFYYGASGTAGGLQGSAFTIPAGASFSKTLSQYAVGYRLIAAGATDVYTFYE